MFAQGAKVSYFRDASPGSDETIAIAGVELAVRARKMHRRCGWTTARLDTIGDIDDDGERTKDEG
jgi:hypothetical protein